MDQRRLALIRSGGVDKYRCVGTGYLIAPRLVLTARHVVVDKSSGEPWSKINVQVGHPRDSDASPRRATVLWAPDQDRDVALLRLGDPVEVSGTVQWGRPVGSAPLRYEALGYPLATVKEGQRSVEHLRGVLPPLAGGADARDLYVLDQDPAPGKRADGKQAWSGASGSAVFCEGHLVGVVIHDDDAFENRRLHACPVRSFADDPQFVDLLQKYGDCSPRLIDISAALSSKLSAHSGEAVLSGRPPAPRTLTQAEEDLLRPLWALLEDPSLCVAHARTLVQRLGLSVPDDYSPSVPELVPLLSEHPRALATLSESLASTSGVKNRVARAELTGLLARGRALGSSALLSVGEHERLMAELRGIVEDDPAVVPRAALSALRFTPLPEVLCPVRLSTADLECAVEGLEALSDSAPVPDGTPQVPALLHLVEYVAAAVDERKGATLREWNNRVAERLGIHPSALAERRSDAGRWAAHRPASASRVLVEASCDDDDQEGRYRCKVWLLRTDSPPAPLPSVTDRPLTAEEVARAVRDAVHGVQSSDGKDHVPLVSVVVDRAGLHLPVDEWNPGPENMFDQGVPLGAEFQLTLSCPEMSALVRNREDAQRRRWQNGHGTPLVIDGDCGTEQQVALLLKTSHRNTRQVVLHGPPGQRARLLDVCLALGVPVVLWDRAAQTYEHASQLDPLQPTGPMADLPERVWSYRGSAYGDPVRHPARPSLVWEDMDPSPLSGLQLLDPAPLEGTAPS
ncbi:trypsin-like peptidase domain-containing protein [Streptomyces sp. NPDC006551]|uniref:VMAP-C domain-containing protein n=1 Tax=Streptomyces sp. NPDC006551 TaxID=3157178 RepID=UPI0033B288AA